MSGWDSYWKTSARVEVDGKPVALEYRAVYDTPHYVALEVHVPSTELERLGYKSPGGSLVLDSAYRESSKVYADSMDDIDVYEMLESKLRKFERLVAPGSRGLTRSKLERLMREQDLDVLQSKTTARPGARAKSARPVTNEKKIIVRRSDGLYLKANGRWSKDRDAAKRFRTTTEASLSAYNALPFSKNFEFDSVEL